MKNQTHDKSRRTILKGLVTIPVLAIAGFESKSYAAMLTADDPYKGGTAAAGPCPIFPGKDVAAAGWCKSWIAKV